MQAERYSLVRMPQIIFETLVDADLTSGLDFYKWGLPCFCVIKKKGVKTTYVK